MITAKKKGTATITVKTHNGLTATVKVKVRSKLKDAYGLLTNKTGTYKKIVRKLKLKRDPDPDSGTVMYYNSQLALIMSANSCQVSLTPSKKPKYSIQGADGSMTAEMVAAKLASKGWKLSGTKVVDGTNLYAFTKGEDTSHYITVNADGSDLLGLDATWTW